MHAQWHADNNTQSRAKTTIPSCKDVYQKHSRAPPQLKFLMHWGLSPTVKQHVCAPEKKPNFPQPWAKVRT